MLFVGLVVAFFALMSVGLRTFVLSRHAPKLMEHDVWQYDRGACLAWGILGPLGLTSIALLEIPVAPQEWLVLIVIWATSVALLWWIPPVLAKKL